MSKTSIAERNVTESPVSGRRESGTQIRVPEADALFDDLRARRDAHPFWDNRLLRAFQSGALTLDDARYVFSQYYLYSRSFTRYVAALMTNCESDFFRARLSENLWEEGGGCDPERRHAQIFRRFLTHALGVTDLDAIEYDDATRLFVKEYLAQCASTSPLVGSAFLSLGTEGIVARLYAILVQGLEKAGVAERDLEFFRIHMDCDDAHAETLEQMTASYSAEPGWYDTCLAAMDLALTLRGRFFDHLFEGLRIRRLRGTLDAIQSRDSLAPKDARTLHHRPSLDPKLLYANCSERLNVDFVVERIPIDAQVLDPRLVRIPPGKFNEKHKHAHETFLYILRGRGTILVDEARLAVAPGDGILIPRWSLHQTQNTGDDEMVFLAVTDFNLTDKAYVGNAHDYRLGRATTLR